MRVIDPMSNGSMTSYVVGFLFSSDLKYVALIKKNRPKWQAGKLNGIGGHIESGEEPENAMIREFHEETGLDVMTWNHFLTLSDCKNFEIFVYYAVSGVADEGEFEEIDRLESKTDEEILIVPSDELEDENVVPNVRWMVPMALSFMKGERASSFDVVEMY